MTSSKNLIQASAGVGGGSFYPYTVDNSARFNDDDSAYLSRTPSAGNSKTFTISYWMKVASPTPVDFMLAARNSSGGAFFSIKYNTNGALQVNDSQNSDALNLVSNALHRDVSSWYHIVVAMDTTQATSSDRCKIYVNGVQITSFSTSSYPAQNANMIWNTAVGHYINCSVNASGTPILFWDGYYSQVSHVDGTALDPTSFGEDKNGVWVPKNISGLTFGTNGFYLDFSNSADLGNDVSGNNNDFTSSGLTSSDQMTDTPTNNYPTLQAAFSISATTYSNGNLEAQQDSGAFKHTRATFGLPTTGKWYWEVQFIDARATDPPSTAFGIGVSDNDGIGDSGYSTGAVIATIPGSTTTYAYEDGAYTPADNITLSNAVVDGDWFGIAYDADTRKMWLWSERDNTWLASGDPANGTNPWKTLTALSASQTYFPIALTQTNDSGRWSKFGVNFGQYAFVGSAPTDFLELKAANLPEPTIGPNSDTKPDEVFEPILYTGNGTSQSISTLEFQPDFTWIKNRDAADRHMLFDAVRGATKYLSSNSTNAEATDAQSLSSFNSNGFSVGNNVQVNTNAEDYVAWNWKENSEFFDIVTWTGTGGAGTISHNLNGTPDMGVVKRRDAADSWYFMSPVTSNYTNPAYGSLNTSGAFLNSGSGITNWNSTDISYASYYGGSGDKWVLYLWKNLDGMCKCGSYTGNGSSDGPMIFTGMRPAFVLVKSSTYAGTFWLMSADPNEYNVVDTYLAADSSNAEFSPYTWIDYLSNGFKLRQTGDSLNRSGQTYIYMAFAENPFKYANAR